MNDIRADVQSEDISSLIIVTRRLSDLLAAETAALRAMRPQEIAPLQEEKAVLTGQYERQLRAFKAQAISLKEIKPELAAELKENTAVLRTLVADNRRALEAARTVNEQLLQTIASEIARQRNPAQTYSRNGQPERASRMARRQAGPLKLDERI